MDEEAAEQQVHHTRRIASAASAAHRVLPSYASEPGIIAMNSKRMRKLCLSMPEQSMVLYAAAHSCDRTSFL